MCTLWLSISQTHIFHSVSVAVSVLFARRAPSLGAVWHQGFLWTVSQHWHVTVERRRHQPSRGHGGAVHLQRPRCTGRPLHAKPGEIRPHRLHPALQPLVSRWVTVPFAMPPSALIIVAHSDAGLWWKASTGSQEGGRSCQFLSGDFVSQRLLLPRLWNLTRPSCQAQRNIFHVVFVVVVTKAGKKCCKLRSSKLRKWLWASLSLMWSALAQQY